MTAVESAIAEIDERLATFAPEYEGLQDFARLNLQPETQEQVRLLSVAFAARIDALRGARAGLETLMLDGHPDFSLVQVTTLVLADLRENLSTLNAAFALFIEQQLAASLALGTGSPVPKA